MTYTDQAGKLNPHIKKKKSALIKFYLSLLGLTLIRSSFNRNALLKHSLAKKNTLPKAESNLVKNFFDNNF